MIRKRTPLKRKTSRADKAFALALLEKLRDGNDVRTRKARRLGAAIRAQRYENNLKLQIALDRMIDQMGA